MNKRMTSVEKSQNYMDPLISIITAVYNDLEGIKECVRSIREQGFTHYEHIVIDGGSDDGTVQFLQELENDSSYNLAYWCSAKDNGVYDAFNKGVKQAAGDWVLFLGADDRLYSTNVLSKIAPVLESLGEDIPLAYGYVDCVNPTGYSVRTFGFPLQQAVQEIYQNGRSGVPLPHQGLFQRRSSIHAVGLFDPRLRIAGDMDIIYRTLKQFNKRAHFLGEYIAKMKIGGMSDSFRTQHISLKEMNRVYRKNQIPERRIHYYFCTLRNWYQYFYVRYPRLIILLRRLGAERIAAFLRHHVHGFRYKRSSTVQYDDFRNEKLVVGMYNATLHSGGAAVAAQRLHSGLVDYGVASHFFAGSGDPKPDDVNVMVPSFAEQKRMARTVDKNYRPQFQYPRQTGFFSPLQHEANWLQKIKQNDHSITHLHWIADGSIPLSILNQGRNPVVWTLHDMWPFTGGCHYSNGCKNYTQSCGNCPILGSNREDDWSRRQWKRKKQVYEQADICVVSPSRWLADESLNSGLLGEKRTLVIPNGIDVNRFHPIEKTSARKALGLPLHKKIVLFGAVNSVTDSRKGFDLLKSYLMSEDRDDIHFLIFGGYMPPEVASAIKISYTESGHIGSTEQLALVYSAADLFLAPSQEENLANTVVEALACGTPIVAFDIGGMPDLIIPGHNGELVRPFDMYDFKNKISKVLSSDSTAYSEAAREYAVINYDIEICVDRYQELYRSLL